MIVGSAVDTKVRRSLVSLLDAEFGLGCSIAYRLSDPELPETPGHSCQHSLQCRKALDTDKSNAM